MNAGKLSHGVGFALAAAIVAGALYATLGPLLGPGLVLRALVVLLSVAYLIFVLSGTDARVGRVSAVAAWLLASALLWLCPLPLGLYLSAHLGLIWLIRSLVRYRSLFSAALDLGLSLVALAAAVWAAGQTGSIALAVWTFFLLQALHVHVPRSPGAGAANAAPDLDFQQACRAAEAALRRIHSRH